MDGRVDGSSSESGEGEPTLRKARRKAEKAKASLLQTNTAMGELIQSHENLATEVEHLKQSIQQWKEEHSQSIQQMNAEHEQQNQTIQELKKTH